MKAYGRLIAGHARRFTPCKRMGTEADLGYGEGGRRWATTVVLIPQKIILFHSLAVERNALTSRAQDLTSRVLADER